METVPHYSAEAERPGAAVTRSAYWHARCAQGSTAPFGDASAWDLFRMVFASVAPPAAHGVPAAGGGCGSP